MEPFPFLIVINDMKGAGNMGFILDIFNLALYIPFLQVDEDDISRNAAQLKNTAGFKRY